MQHNELINIISFIRKAENLKNTLRSAHTSNGRQESSAEHSWGLCLLVLVLGKFFEGLDTYKMLKLSLVHDLAEAITGDIPAVDETDSNNKSMLERQAMLDLCTDLPKDLHDEFILLWEEYESLNTPESMIIKGLDKLETIAQHNIGKNPPNFDYKFNLSYGQEYMRFHPLLQQIRAILDAETNKKI